MEEELDERDIYPSDWEPLIEAAYRRVQQGLPPEPWLPRVVSLKRLRRQVRRARAGIIKPDNPAISTRAWADTLEQGIVMNAMEIIEERRHNEEVAQREAAYQQQVLKYNQAWMEAYRTFKRMPEANDPQSEVAIQIAAMKRELRKLRGRPRKRKRRRG